MKQVHSSGQPTMQRRSNCGDAADASDPSQSPIDPSALENQLPQSSSVNWLPPDHHQALEQMPELVHGHGSNDGEIDPDADIADPVPSHHLLLNQQANLVRFFDYTHDPFLQPDDLSSAPATNPAARLDETYVHGDVQSTKLQFSSQNRQASWDSNQFRSQPAATLGLLQQQGSSSPTDPKDCMVQAQAHITEDRHAFQSDMLHSPAANANQFQYMFPSEVPALPLGWPNDFTIPPSSTTEWDPFTLSPEGLPGAQEIPARGDAQNPVCQDQVNIPPGVEALGDGVTHPILQQLLPEPSLSNVPKAEDSQYHGGLEHEPVLKEESIDSFYLSSPLSTDNYSTAESRQFEGDDRSIGIAETTADLSPSRLVPVAQGPPIHSASQETASSSTITRPRGGSVSSKRTKWRGTPNLPQLTTEPRKSPPDGTSSNPEQPFKTSPLQIVQEDGQGGSISGSAYKMTVASRARRMGPLSNTGRRDAALRRKHKNVCVWCRLAKKKCSGDSPCTTCLKTMILEQPCVKADFFQIVESGTCNYISQRAVHHLTLDKSTRVRMELPATFDMSQLLSLVDERRGRFNIRARQSWGPLYVLDMDETYKFLRDMNKGEVNAQHDLGDFIDNRILKTNKWLRCVKDCDPMRNLFALLSQWNNMPSRASYEFVSTSDEVTDRPMNIQDPEDQTEILLAAQLSRIICRKLEIDGYKALQNVLSNHRWDEFSSESLTRFVSQLGQILLTLRWRASWWEVLGDGRINNSTPSSPGSQKSSSDHERYEYRVQNLCKILYVYYTSIRLKLPSWVGPDTAPDGVWSMYADAAPVWDDFPSVPTAEGFKSWMERGKELIREADVQSRIAKF